MRMHDFELSGAKKMALELFDRARNSNSFVATVSIKEGDRIVHKTIRVGFPAKDLEAVLNHVESSFYGMGMTRTEDEERMRLQVGEDQQGSVPLPAPGPMPAEGQGAE